MKDSVYRCSHLGIFTNKPGELVEFYTSVLEFQQVKESTISREIMEALMGVSRECTLVLLQRGGVGIEIFSSPDFLFEEGSPHLKAGYNHWGLVVEDREAFCSQIGKKAEILQAQKNGRTIYFLRDPDGNRIEIQSQP